MFARGGTARHCVDQYSALLYYYSLLVDTVMPGGLYARLYHAFLVSVMVQCGRLS